MSDEPNSLEIENESLWKIVRALKRWVKAFPGKDSSEKEFELVQMLKALPPQKSKEESDSEPK